MEERIQEKNQFAEAEAAAENAAFLRKMHERA
jgi:hypothetical protein